MSQFNSYLNDITIELSSSTRRLSVLFSLFGAADYIGEPVSIIEHSLQCAYLSSLSDPLDEELIIACLLHDIGHLLGLEAGQTMEMDGCGVEDHENIGGDFILALGFSKRISNFVRNHVSAKRYLCYKNKAYYDNLSSASRTTLGYQGGPMSSDESIAYENDPDFKAYLLMRSFDEAAKEENLNVPPFSSYYPLLEKLLKKSTIKIPAKYILSQPQISYWKTNGFIKIRNIPQFLCLDINNTIVKWVDDISSWNKVDNKWLLHYELNKKTGNKQLCRIENFVNYHQEMSTFVKLNIKDIASQLFEEEAVLFKEKINFKLPGGCGFFAHQDTPAYIGMAENFLSCMVSIDAATIDNGCLEVSSGKYVKNQIPLTDQGIIEPVAEENMIFQYVTCMPGDIVLFDGYLPHRSNTNITETQRRAIFLTYNPASEGDHHEPYYAAKHSGHSGFNSNATISFQGDFQGVIVE